LPQGANPFGTFFPESIISLPGTYRQAQVISFQVSWDLTVREVTNPATFEATVRFDNGVLSGNAVAKIRMGDWR
jgi:hypothetical protein